MRCLYGACDRRAGWRKFCPAHRVWVAYLRQLRAAEDAARKGR